MKSLFALTSRSRQPLKSNPRGRSRRNLLCCESLETRSLLATIAVDTFDDVIDPLDGLTSLREAVIQANTLPGDDVIELQAGTYSLTLPNASQDENQSATGDLDIRTNDSVTIMGVGAEQTVIDAGGQGGLKDRVFDINGRATLRVTDLTVSGGRAVGLAATNQGGGFSVAANATLEVTRSLVSGNSGVQGGGIENFGTLIVTDSTISNNDARGNSGGGLNNKGNLANATIVRTAFADNFAPTSGVAISNQSASLLVTESTFSGNSAGSGGAIRGTGEFALIDSTFSGNTAIDAGGGVFADSTASVEVIRSTFSGNTAPQGGGVAADGGRVDISSSTLSDNTAGAGGGLFVRIGDVNVINSTISNNSANNGGGIQQETFSFGGSLNVEHSTITGNTATENGGGIDVTTVGGATGGPLLSHTIVAGNVTSDGTTTVASDLSGEPVDPTSSYNLIGDADSAGGLVDGVLGNIVGVDGVGVRDINTILDTNLADNGGPTLTHALVEGSVAIDAGDPVLATPPETDQRGEARIQDGDGDLQLIIDMGAVEADTIELSSPGVTVEDRVLKITGTSEDEWIVVKKFFGNYFVLTDIPGYHFTKVAASEVDAIHAEGLEGDDIIVMGLFVRDPATISGGAGNDLLWGGFGDDLIDGGEGDDILLGGAGNDRVYGGSGRDLLIGGTGSDLLKGGRGKDILTGGTTNFDDDQAMLNEIIDTWSGPGSDQSRMDDVLELGLEVIDDGENDLLFGNSRCDWIWSE